MLEVQRFLQEGGSLDDLNQVYGINSTHDKSEPLVILNYDQIASRPKNHPVVRECRGLTLEKSPGWPVVARSFGRFFNAGECPEDDAAFDWTNFTAREKCDGSLMSLYFYKGWRVNTRGSFARDEMSRGLGKTWEDVFWSALTHKVPLEYWAPTWTWVFELCSPYNKVVRRYAQPTLYLLSAFRNRDGLEAAEGLCDTMAAALGVRRPEVVAANNLAALQHFLETHEDPTYEGVVVRDGKGRRLKVKSPRYVALHRMRGNGDNLFLPKNLLPFVLSGERGELLTYFPEATEAFSALERKVRGWLAEVKEVWESARRIPSQKDFALYILPRTRLAAVLFEARKNNEDPEVVFRRMDDLILKLLSKEAVPCSPTPTC